MKKIIIFFVVVFLIVGCDSKKHSSNLEQTLNIWTYKIGDWANEDKVERIIEKFAKENDINVRIEYLDYLTDQYKISEAKKNGCLPDIIFSRPEDVIIYTRDDDILLDISDLYDENDKNEIYKSVINACQMNNGYYFYPVSTMVFCMGINKEALIESGCEEIININTHTWSTDDFLSVIDKMYQYYGKNILTLYCEGQGGDYGVRSLYKNLYNGKYIDEDLEFYTMDDKNILLALNRIISTNGIEINPSLSGGDAIVRFMENKDKIVLCWDANLQTIIDDKNNKFEISYISFPCDDNNPELYSEIYGYSLIDSGNDYKINKSKDLIKYLADSNETPEIIKSTHAFPVRDSIDGLNLENIWSENAIFNEYKEMVKYSGRYEQIADHFDRSRVQAVKMLQNIFKGISLNDAVEIYQEETNKE